MTSETKYSTLIVGEYRTTRIVEQHASLYDVVYHMSTNVPSVLPNLMNKRDGQIRSQWPNKPFNSWLFIFDFYHLNQEEVYGWVLPACRLLSIDVLLLDHLVVSSAFQRKPSNMRLIDWVIKFPMSDGSLPKPVLWEPFYPVPFGSYILILVHHDSRGGYSGSTARPVQKAWTPEQHSLYPENVHQRVLLLLLAQRDSNSLLSRLDSSCLLEILRCGAALDSE